MFTLTVIAVGMLFVFCGSNYPLLRNAESSKAEQLRKYCAERNLTSRSVQDANSLVEKADSLAEAGSEEESYWAHYQAVVLYRTALAEADLEENRTLIAQLEEELAQTRQQLKTYEEVLNELDQTRAP
jgi:hypothetical protein